MYTIIMNDDKSLVATNRTTLYQREKLVDKIQFLIPQKYKSMDLSTCVAKLKYIDQGNISHSEQLTKDAQLYKNRLRYILPIDNKINYFAGNISAHIVFTSNDGKQKLHTGNCIITIEPSSTIIDEDEKDTDDTNPSDMYKKITELESKINELQETQVNDLKLTDDLLQLAIDDEAIGNGIILPRGSFDDTDEDGTPVLDFDSNTSSSDDDGSAVIEF